MVFCKTILRTAVIFVALTAMATGCSKNGASGHYYIEIAPAKFAAAKFSELYSRDLVLKYGDKIVHYEGHVEANPPECLMEYEGKLYLLAFQAIPNRPRKEWRWLCFQQDGDRFKEIQAKDFPRRVAILNIWRPGDPSRYATGMKAEDKIDFLVQSRELDPENKYFVNSDQARLWYMLEIENNLEKAEREFYGEQAKTFLQEYIAKYNPVRLTSMELKPVPKDECNF